MILKKHNGKVYGADLTSKEREAMELEIKRQIAEMDRKHLNDIDATVLFVLHEHLGFGKKRLRRFYDAFNKVYLQLIEHYEMPDDLAWIADVKLKEIGVDVAAWNKELNNDEVR